MIVEFLTDLLASQELLPHQETLLQQHKTEVTDYLRSQYGNAPIIKYAGSREKGTMIRDNYDLDIVCYFPSDDNRSLKEIREGVQSHLAKQYVLQPKTSAERILDLRGASAPIGYHIDVVPGRFIQDTKDVFLHVNTTDRERLQTNLKTHIDFITNSGCVPVIRLVKIWCHRNRINIKTFIAEIFVVRSLEGFNEKSNLKSAFLHVLESFKDNFEKIQLIDPANTNNIVSEIHSAVEKSIIANTAEHAFNKLKDSTDLNLWQGVFQEYVVGNNTSASRGFVPNEPISSAPRTVGRTIIQNAAKPWAR